MSLEKKTNVETDEPACDRTALRPITGNKQGDIISLMVEWSETLQTTALHQPPPDSDRAYITSTSVIGPHWFVFIVNDRMHRHRPSEQIHRG